MPVTSWNLGRLTNERIFACSVYIIKENEIGTAGSTHKEKEVSSELRWET